MRFNALFLEITRQKRLKTKKNDLNCKKNHKKFVYFRKNILPLR